MLHRLDRIEFTEMFGGTALYSLQSSAFLGRGPINEKTDCSTSREAQGSFQVFHVKFDTMERLFLQDLSVSMPVLEDDDTASLTVLRRLTDVEKLLFTKDVRRCC